MRAVVALLACVLVAASLTVPATAHVNDVRADAQISPDGTVIVETAFIGDDGFVTIQRDANGNPGAVIGYAPLDGGAGLVTDVAVAVDDDAWREWGESRTVHVVLRSDDGDGTFEADEDPVITSFGEIASAAIPVGKGERALVTARGFGPQASDDGTVTIRRATLPVDGHLIIENATNGNRVGSVSLSAGTHQNVTVEVAPSGERLTARAVLYRDDGNGELDEGDTPLTVGGEPVATRFGVEFVERTTTAVTGTATDTETPALVTTATPTTTPTVASTTTSDGQPGFGVLAALVIVVGWGWWRRR